MQSYKDPILSKNILKTQQIKSFSRRIQKVQSPIIRIGVWLVTLRLDLRKLVNFSYAVVSSTQWTQFKFKGKIILNTKCMIDSFV